MRDHTDITLVLDRSGSMDLLVDTTVEQVNAFIDQQARVGRNATLTLVTFDDVYEQVFVDHPIDRAPRLCLETYTPRGATALYDAICRAIDDTGHRLASLPEEERPDKVVFVIVTDGEENSSVRANRPTTFEKIRHQEQLFSWKFLYLGANQDAMVEGAKMGVRADRALTYEATPTGMQMAMSAASKSVASYRTGDSSAVFSADDRRSATITHIESETA